MNKRIRKLLAFLTLTSAVFGILVNPQESKADYDYNHPPMTYHLEFVDQKGNDFPVTMGMEGMLVKGKRTYPGPTYTLLSADPLSITKASGKNFFTFNIPAASGKVTVNNDDVIFLSNLKINSPMPFVKSITTQPLDPMLPTLNNMNFMIVDADSGVVTQDNPISASNFRGIKQGDDTFLFAEGSPTYTVGGYTPLGNVWLKWFLERSYGRTYQVFGKDGDKIRFYVEFYQVEELFEDQTGVSIPAPPGYTNGNTVSITSVPFSYQMTNDSGLPKTYVDSGYIYTYEGWYKGAGNKATMNTTHPPSINFSADLNEPQNEVHIVYNKKLVRTVNEEYIDTGSATIESSWNNMGQSKADGDTFTQTPAATKTDSSGAIWEYQGWKLSTEPMSSMRPKATPVSVLINANKTIQYVYKKKQHTITEKWVDQADGSTLVPMAGNPKTNSIDDNDPFNGSATATITDNNGGIWDYVGWENVTDAAGTINPAASYTINNIKGGKEIRYHYQARNTTATLDLTPNPKVVLSGGNVAWTSRLTNTGTSALNNLKLKATSNWASGLSDPVKVTVTPAGGSSQDFVINSGDWAAGINLTGINISNVGPNNYADITFSTTATGAVNQVLPAEIEIDGNMASPLTAENFVRIDDPDEPNLEPLGNAGLINIPTFKFGEVEVKPFAQTKGLDTSAYQSGYHPYIRFMDMESTGGWNLTAKLGQFTSGSKTLPTSTTIKLKNGMLMDVQNYNKPNETLNNLVLAGTVSIPSDSSTVALTNGTNQGVYHLEYDLNHVELELMAHSGVAGLSYTANMDWTLTTAP